MVSIGAFVGGNKDIIQFLRYNLRSQIFAKSLPMPIVEGNIKRLELLRKNPSFKDKLWENVTMLQQGLRKKGFDLGNTQSCVTPVFMHGTPEEAGNLVKDLRENYNVFCSVVLYPVVPKDVILLRLIPTASHTKKDIEETIFAFGKIAEKLKAGMYDSAKVI